MQAETGPNWLEEGAYAPLLAADRSFLAWEWLRRDPLYRAAARRWLSVGEVRRRAMAASFGLVDFEPPQLTVPHARPMWRRDVHPGVLTVECCASAKEMLEFDKVRRFATLISGVTGDHLLLSDGLRAIRLDAPFGTFANNPLCLRYRIEGLARAEPLVLTLRRLLVLCRNGDFAQSLHPAAARARRSIRILRAWDGVRAGATQREIAEVLLSSSAAGSRWRSRNPSLRSQAQRLVQSARVLAQGGYRLHL